MADRTGGPLAGVRVLELGTMYAAPTCGRMLRDFGADVIKVEDPGTGDYARQWTPMKNGQSFGFARLNALLVTACTQLAGRRRNRLSRASNHFGGIANSQFLGTF